MPEGHTIHRAARDQTKQLVGPLSVSSPQGRFAEGVEVLDGDELRAIHAYGKHLVYEWHSGHLLHVHLGLFGKFRTHLTQVPSPRPTVRVRLTARSATIDLSGPTTCELLDEPGLERLLDRLGPDPLRADADPEDFHARCSRSRAAIGALLLDQSAIAGVGNVYRAEALFVCGIDPARQARSLSEAERVQLWNTITTMLTSGVKAGRIVTVDPVEVGMPRSKIPRRQRTYAYQRQSCLRCGNVVNQGTLATRTIYWCATCQR
jgi:endonuclease VIII